MDLTAFDPFSSGNGRSIDQILLEMGFIPFIRDCLLV